MFHRILALAILGAVPACQPRLPISGTPLQTYEGFETGVRRQLHLYSTRRVDIVASSRKLAANIADLLQESGASAPTRVLLAGTYNPTSLPFAAFEAIHRQIIRELQAAGRLHGIAFVEPGTEPDPSPVHFFLHLDFYSLSSQETQSFLIVYTLNGLPAHHRSISMPCPPRARNAADLAPVSRWQEPVKVMDRHSFVPGMPGRKPCSATT